MNSEPIKLVPGKVAGLRLSGGERSLLKFADDTFGGPLSQFLLAGMEEDGEARRRLFIIKFADNGGTWVRRRLYVEAENLTPEAVTSLPRGREPLVILALLRLLLGDRKPPRATLYYTQEEVLSLLGWEDTPESRSLIDEAVDRHSYLTYRWALSKKELAARNLSFYRSREHFVFVYGHSDVEEAGGHMKRVTNRINFSSVFIEELTARSLFDVDWNKVRGITHKVLG